QQEQRQRPRPLGERQEEMASVVGAESRRPDERPPAAEAETIWKSFGRTKALQDVSVSVLPGECHALVGRNGAGKSTLVGVLTGLLKPESGNVRLYGEPAPNLGDRAGWQEPVACVY